jgi:hypothetical protein
MPLPPRRVIQSLFWMQILILGVTSSLASAQEGSQIRLAPIDTSEFPQITSYLDIRSPEGDFVYGMEIQDISIIEDGVQLPVDEFKLLHSEVQFVLAINPGPAFDIRDVQGLTRYDYIVQSLLDWANSRLGSTVDDFSIVVAGGPESTHQSKLDEFIESLVSSNAEEQETSPEFDTLARALDVAADPTSSPGMPRILLFVTALPEQDVSLGLQSLAAQANQRGVRIFVWLVASAELFNSPEASQLATLAEQTGGKMFAYSGLEPIPSPEEYLDSLRSTYYLAYNSQISTSDPHQVSVEVNLDGQSIVSPVQEFELEVLPPIVAFVSPPMEIERSFPEESDGESDNLLPSSQFIELMVEFPDGYTRPLKQTSLLVDGFVVEIKTTEPFDLFIWDLDEYNSNGEHILQAEVVDILGLTGNSADTAIDVVVSGSSTNVWQIISKNRMLLAGIVVALSGAVLVFVLVVGGRLRPGFLRELRQQEKGSGPITQPIRVKTEPASARRATWVKRLHWPRRRISSKAYAFMIPLRDTDQEDSAPPILITGDEVTFGSDPERAKQVLDDPSVDPLHAHLQREASDDFRLSDSGSTAGTWVNYSPVSKEGTRIEHGDLVHIGRVGYRFVFRAPKRVRKPVQRLEEPSP